ncbi:MAG TPA: dienelactone hydrolase family protein [Candidatus Binatia bacterium]|nr:dienelactone hydrolase family protein [Candidatus Binatia bacterium]
MPNVRVQVTDVRFRARDATIAGVLVAPQESTGGSVVLLPDVRGVADLYVRMAGRIAELGLPTLVLDVYSREGAPELPDMEAVFRCIAELPDDRVLGDVDAAVSFLEEREPRGTRSRAIAVVGFCLGGQYALMAACRNARLAACVSFYGMLRYDARPPHKPASPLDLAPGLRCPLLGLYGADDVLIPARDRVALEEILVREKKEWSLHVFGGAGHAFANDTRADYRPETAEVAWGLASGFLRRMLAA